MITLNLCGLNTTRIDGNTTKLKSTRVGVDFGSKILFGTEKFFSTRKNFRFYRTENFFNARKTLRTENSFFGTDFYFLRHGKQFLRHGKKYFLTARKIFKPLSFRSSFYFFPCGKRAEKPK